VCALAVPSIAVFSSKKTFVVQSLAVAAMLFVHSTTAKAGVLLDNTSNLTNTSLGGNAYAWSQSSAYNTINGFTFDVGPTSYDATDVTLRLMDFFGPITPNMRIQVWELADLTSFGPAVGASAYYTLNDNTKTFDSTARYYTFLFNNGTLNLKANTRYSIGFSTDLIANPDYLFWLDLSPANVPTGTAGLTSSGLFNSTNGGASYTASGNQLQTAFQLNGTLAGSGAGAGGGGGAGVAVPEPSSMAIFGLGALGMAYHVRRKSIARRESKA
jgi:hypothetical protein